MRTDTSPPALRTLAVWITVLICTAATALLVWQGSYDQHPDLRYADSGLPMITAADGFFYLAQAKDAGATSAPLLSRLARHAADATGLPLESVAFWLPCLLAAGMAFWYAGWARLLHLSITAAVLAAAAGSLMPAWVERSRIGWFDTDPGIAFLWQGTLWATACLGLPAYASGMRLRHRLTALAVLVLCGGLLAWWWMPGAALLPLCLALLGITFPWADTRREGALRLGLLLVVVIGGLLALFLPDALLPQAVSRLRLYALDHARLILGMKEGLIYASIAELDPVKADVYLRTVGGGVAGGVVVLGAVLAFACTQRAATLFLLPALGMLVLGIFGERFLYLAALPLGLALGWLPTVAAALGKDTLAGRHACAVCATRHGQSLSRPQLRSRPLSERLSSLRGSWVCGLLLVGVAFGNMLYFLSGWVPDGHFRQEHDTVAVHLRRASTPAAPVWNWWDDGYFLQARTGLRPLFDGGTQAPDVAFVAARPMVMENTLLARRWIRFFALRGVQALGIIEQHWGGAAKADGAGSAADALGTAVAALERVLAAPHAEAAEAVLRTLPPLPPELGDARAWLFPQERVFLYLSQRVLRLSQWWMPLGTQRHPDRQDPRQLRTHIDTISAEGLAFNTATGELTLPRGIAEKGYSTVQGAYLTDVKPLTEPWPDKGGIYLVASLQNPWLYMVTGQALPSLPLRLMAPGGLALEGFAPIAVDYNAAGAWEVLP